MERYGFDDVWDLLREQEEARERKEAGEEGEGKEAREEGEGKEAREEGEAAENVAGDAMEMTGKETAKETGKEAAKGQKGAKGAKGANEVTGKKGKSKGKGKYMSDPGGFTWVSGNPLVYRAEETDWGDQRLDIFLTPRRPGGVQPVLMDILGRRGKPISDHYGIMGTFAFSKDALAGLMVDPVAVEVLDTLEVDIPHLF